MTRSVLIVEDEFTIAIELARILSEVGFEVVGPVPDVSSAVSLIESRTIVAAVLDANLKGESAEPVALRLREMGVPFFIVTGYAARQLGDWTSGVTVLGKPCADADVIAALNQIVD